MEPVRYRVRFPAPETHLFELEATFPADVFAGGDAVFWLPVWTPGSYLVREFARHVEGVSAADAAGAKLACERLDKRSWRVARPATPGPVTLRWKVFARDLTVRTSYLDADLAYFNGANLFLTSDAVVRTAIALEVEVPPGRRAVCALPSQGPGRFAARHYDELCDSPVAVHAGAHVEFEVRGKPHVLSIAGTGPVDPQRMAADLAKLVEVEAGLFGGLPYDRYAFLVLLTDKGRGGLEHEASCALLYPRHGLADPRTYEDFLQLAAHEVFHLWNVKRIKPAALVPYDYSQEQYTRLLWAFEGFTSYYDVLVPCRAGLYSEQRFLEKMGESATDVQRTPGRQVVSLSEASLCAWVKYYRPDENSPNSTVSYYVKGEVMAMLLDLALREATGNARSLDDVMRLLWERHGQTGAGVPEDGVEAAAVEVGGEAIRDFFARYVRGTEELPYEEKLEVAGVAVGRRQREGERDKGGTPPREREKATRGWFGASVREGDRPVVASVLRGSPAERAGVAADDELVALDGERLDGSWASRLEQKRPGETSTLHVFRRGQLRALPLTFGERPKDTLWLARDEQAPEPAKAILASWLRKAP